MLIRQHGMATRGVLSSAAVSVILGDEEAEVLEGARQIPRFCLPQGPSLLQRIFWARYVDDLLSFSFQYCSACLSVFFGQVHREKLSVVRQSDGAQGHRVREWVDIDLHFWESSFLWLPKNLNRGWLFRNEPPLRSTILPWMGSSPIRF